jgi:hypothetical protein
VSVTKTELSDAMRAYAAASEAEAQLLDPFPELQSKKLEEAMNLRTAADRLDAYRETFA